MFPPALRLLIVNILLALILPLKPACAQRHLDIINNSKSKTFKEIVQETEAYYKDRDKGKGSGYKQFKRWEYFHERILREGENVIDFSLRRLEEFNNVKSRKNRSGRIGGPPSAGAWQAVGPERHQYANQIGRINTVVVDPSNPKFIYAGSPAGGLWRSLDGGGTWRCLTDNIFSFMGITSIVIDPLSPQDNRTIYILTGDKDGADTSYAGIFKSVDNGNSWTRIPYFWNIIAAFYKLMLHPVDNKLLFMINDVGMFLYGIGTTNQWQLRQTGEFTDLEFHPTLPHIAYISGPSGTFRTTDTGQTWTKVSSAIPISARMELAVTPASPSVVYLFLGERSVTSLYKSVDSGLTFLKVQTTFDFREVAASQWRYDLALAVSPDNANNIFLGGINLYQSADGGVNWVRDGMGHVDYHSLDFYHGLIYAGNDGGITRRPQSALRHSQFVDLSHSLMVSQIYRLGVDQSAENHILIGTQDNGTSSVVDRYAMRVSGGDGMECFVDPQNPTTLFSSQQFGTLYKAFREPDWINYYDISPPDGPTMWLTPFRMDPSDPMVLYAGRADIWKNPQQGDVPWVNVSNGAMGQKSIAEFVVAPSNSNYLYVLKSNQDLYKTVDGGANWRLLGNDLAMNVFAVHPENPDVLWAGRVSHTDRIVVKSTDGGVSWQDVSGSLPHGRVSSIVYQNGTPDGIYVGTEEGVFYKDNTLSDWIRFDNGMPYSPITDLEINYKTGKIYAGTYGRGVWVSDLYTQSTGTCDLTGTIRREVWMGIGGSGVSSIPVASDPSGSSDLTLFEGPANEADNYGARIRGYVCPPATGLYTFWISSNDHSELWLSIDENPANKVRIASVTGYTNVRQWDKYQTQRSVAVNLTAGNRYYIEALHKEGVGSDHIAVGWQHPGGMLERPIPGVRLIPFVGKENNPPEVSITTPSEGQNFWVPASVDITATAVDSDGQVSKVEFYEGSTKLGEDATAPYAFTWNDLVPGHYELIARAIDDETASARDTITFRVNSSALCQETGAITRELWTGITGTSVSSIPVNTIDVPETELLIFEGPANSGDHYGSRISGRICAPSTGKYTFWIASNDHSELWLAVDDNKFNRVRIAFVSGYTNVRQWDKYATQRSVPIDLIGGQQYYIEALHKEGVGSDHVAVGWQLPDGTLERPIPGIRLIPNRENNRPVVSITNPSDRQIFSAPATINITADASDTDGTVTVVEFYSGRTLLGSDTSAPYTFSWTNVPAGDYKLEARAIDNSGTENISESISISITDECVASGTITRQYWNDIPGSSVLDIPVNDVPDRTHALAIFEEPSNTENNYGARIRGYICAPSTGNYVFWISSNDHSELWLGSNDDPLSKIKIAHVAGATSARQWDRFSSQRSAPVLLTAGKRYFIEALHKQGAGSAHIAVGWQLPDATLERPIPGSRLSPFEMNMSSARLREVAQMNASMVAKAMSLTLFPNPLKEGIATLVISVNEGTPEVGEAHVEIISITGESIYSQTVVCQVDCNKISIDIDRRFAPGIYLVNARINRKRFSTKLLVGQ